MPVLDQREFGGRFSVAENSLRLANYRYLEVQLMELLGGWCHTTSQLAIKATFGYHVYDHAHAADSLGERIGHLRSSPDREEPASDEFVRLCEHIWNFSSPTDRLVAVYRVLEPHLVSTYVYHADATDPLADAPTVQLLRRLAGIDQSHIAWGQAIIDSMTSTPDGRKRALEVQADVEARLVTSGGVTGRGIEAHWLAFQSTQYAQPARNAGLRKANYRFTKQCADIDCPVVEAPFWFSENLQDFKTAYSSDDEWSILGFRHKFHELLYGEVETTDRMGKMLAEFPGLPWPMRVDLAHQMWDEARHIEIVARICEDDLGATMGYGPWTPIWWPIQNEKDPLHRIAVNNGWAEANLMHTLRVWRNHAQKQGFQRIAELADYLQADELNHVRVATVWVRELTQNDPRRLAELVQWGLHMIPRIQNFYADEYHQQVHFSFLTPDENKHLQADLQP